MNAFGIVSHARQPVLMLHSSFSCVCYEYIKTEQNEVVCLACCSLERLTVNDLVQVLKQCF